MDPMKVTLLVLLVITLLSSVLARPHDRSTSGELVNIASELTDTLNEIVDMMHAERPRRRRRMVQYVIARHHHNPKHYRRYRRGRRVYRSQRGGRNADISDH